MKQLMTVIGVAAYVAAAGWALHAQPAGDGPRYSSGNTLIRPADYREWPFLGAGLGLTYQAESPNPGAWRDGTIFILEFRRSADAAPISPSGRYQTQLVALEANVKDSRFPDGWAFFEFGRGNAIRDTAEPLGGERAAGCVECHTKHTAVERTFVQFYPTLLEVARQKKTVKAGF